NPREVLDHSKRFKEEGNSSFKKGDIDGALHYFEHGASLLKKKDFMQAGLLCSLVLNYNPENVKALFRRAIAAMELGKVDLAFWDLQLAHKVESSNQEVIKKLNEVEKALHKPPLEHDPRHVKECCPLGLDSVTKGNETISNKSKRSKINRDYLDSYTLVKVKKSERRKQTKDLDYGKERVEEKEPMVNDRVDDKKVVSKEIKETSTVMESKYHFHSKKKTKLCSSNLKERLPFVSSRENDATF
ncbi:Peptidyl-prolyl cis-trans isomerase FKBP62, partial [Bienertia sinuspersici]